MKDGHRFCHLWSSLNQPTSHSPSFSVNIHPRGRTTCYQPQPKSQNDSWYGLRDINLRTWHQKPVSGILCYRSTLHSFFYQSSYIPVKHCGILTHLGRKKPILLFTDLNKTFAESLQLRCQCYFYLLPNICHLQSLPCRLSNLQYLIPVLLLKWLGRKWYSLQMFLSKLTKIKTKNENQYLQVHSCKNLGDITHVCSVKHMSERYQYQRL